MARVVIATTAFPAHTDWGGLRELAVELRTERHDVLWLTGERVVGTIRSSGLECVVVPVVDPYRGGREVDLRASGSRRELVNMWRLALRMPRDLLLQQTTSTIRSYSFLVRCLADAWLHYDQAIRSIEAIATIIARWRPDIVIAEPLMLPAALAAEATSTTLVGCGYPGAVLSVPGAGELSRLAEQVRLAKNRLRKYAGVAEHPAGSDIDLFFVGAVHVVFLPAWWLGTLSARCAQDVFYLDDPSRARVEDAAPPSPSTGGRRTPLIQVAVSSSYLPARDEVATVFEAIGRAGARGRLAGNDQLRRHLDPLPSHIEWAGWVDYRHALRHADAIVHHGGLGTTLAAARAALPQVVMPGAIDQILHAEAIARAGAGLLYTGDISPEPIKDRLQTALSSKTIRRGAILLSRECQIGQGLRRVAEMLTDFCNRSATRVSSA